MGLKIVCPVEYQRVKKVSLTAMPFGVLPAKAGQALRHEEERITIHNMSYPLLLKDGVVD